MLVLLDAGVNGVSAAYDEVQLSSLQGSLVRGVEEVRGPGCCR